MPMLASWLELRDLSSPNVIVGLLRIFLSLVTSGVKLSFRLLSKRKDVFFSFYYFMYLNEIFFKKFFFFEKRLMKDIDENSRMEIFLILNGNLKCFL